MRIRRYTPSTHVIFADSDMVLDVNDRVCAMATLLEMSGRNEAGATCGELETGLGAPEQ